MSGIELKPCILCGSKHRELNGYDIHKVSCSDEKCPISYLAITQPEWNSNYTNSPLHKENAQLKERNSYLEAENKKAIDVIYDLGDKMGQLVNHPKP